jgi:hypothetical protein
MTELLAWYATDHVKAPLAEALVATALYRIDPDTEWCRPRNPHFDVDSKSLGIRPDAKVANIVFVQLDSGDSVEALEWRASTSGLGSDATHLAPVKLDEQSVVRLTDGAGPLTLEISGSVSGRVWLLPRDVADRAVPIWSPKNDRASAGEYRYLPTSVADAFEITDLQADALRRRLSEEGIGAYIDAPR